MINKNINEMVEKHEDKFDTQIGSLFVLFQSNRTYKQQIEQKRKKDEKNLWLWSGCRICYLLIWEDTNSSTKLYYKVENFQRKVKNIQIESIQRILHQHLQKEIFLLIQWQKAMWLNWQSTKQTQ